MKAVDSPAIAAADFLGMVVHELRAPLTVTRGQVQLARRHLGRDPMKERVAIDTAIVQMDRMEQLISELLDYSRLAANGLSLTVVAFDLVGAVESAVARHEYEAKPRISLKRSVESLRVRGDPDRIAQILTTEPSGTLVQALRLSNGSDDNVTSPPSAIE